MTSPGAPEPSLRVGRGAFLGLAALTTGALLVRGNIPAALTLLPATSSVGGFTIYTIAGFPVFNPATYRLQVTGMVAEPASYSFDDLLAMPVVHETRYYQCVTGWSVPAPRWSGVRLWDLVTASRPAAGAGALHFRCMDNAYTESLTFEQAQHRDVLLAYALNGRALSRQQGHPLRLVVPGMYGHKYAKWVDRVEIVDRVIPGYWEQNGYDVDAYIQKI